MVIHSTPSQGTRPLVRPMVRALPACGSWPHPIWLYKVADRRMVGTGIRKPGLVTWLFWVVLTAFGGIVGTFLLSFVSNANVSLTGLLIWFYLASPLFFVALGQWLLLRRFVAQSGWWLLTGILGFIFVYPYLLIYSSSTLFTSGKSLIFGTLEFWIVS